MKRSDGRRNGGDRRGSLPRPPRRWHGRSARRPRSTGDGPMAGAALFRAAGRRSRRPGDARRRADDRRPRRSGFVPCAQSPPDHSAFRPFAWPHGQAANTGAREAAGWSDRRASRHGGCGRSGSRTEPARDREAAAYRRSRPGGSGVVAGVGCPGRTGGTHRSASRAYREGRFARARRRSRSAALAAQDRPNRNREGIRCTGWSLRCTEESRPARWRNWPPI